MAAVVVAEVSSVVVIIAMDAMLVIVALLIEA